MREPELRIVGDQELKPVTQAQLDLALKMLGYRVWGDETATQLPDPSDTSSKQPQRVEGGNPYGNRAERRANSSKRGGTAFNGRRMRRQWR